MARTSSRTHRFVVAALAAVSLLAGASLVVAPAASAAGSYGTDDYPDKAAVCTATVSGACAGYDWSGLSSRGFYKRNCTDFVAWRLGISYGSLAFPMGNGNANGWKQGAINSGYQWGTTPVVGAVAWWGSSNHVAVVTAVNPDGSARIEEYNGDFQGTYSNARYNVRAEAYLYIGVSPAQPGPGLGEMGPVAPKADFAIYRASGGTGYWYIKRNEGGNATSYAVNGWTHGGWAGDIPLTGDFTGDKIADFAIYRNGTWYVMSSATGGHTAIWGATHGGWAQDVPVAGDFNGDGYADFGIYRPSGGTGYWYVKSGATGQPIPSAWGVQHGGWAQDVPVAGDFNGDGYADFGIYRPSGGTGYWYVRSGVNVSSMIVNGATNGGWDGDIPLAGNFG